GVETGDFVLARGVRGAVGRNLGAPPEAAFLVQTSLNGAGATPGRYLFLDADLHRLRDEPRPDYRFDPRTREWYRRALRSAGPVRTPPYVFFTTREVGTTLAQRSADASSVV